MTAEAEEADEPSLYSAEEQDGALEFQEDQLLTLVKASRVASRQ